MSHQEISKGQHGPTRTRKEERRRSVDQLLNSGRRILFICTLNKLNEEREVFTYVMSIVKLNKVNKEM